MSSLISACSPKDLSLPGIPLGTAFSQGQEAPGRKSLGIQVIGNALGNTDKDSRGIPTAWPDRVYAPSGELHRVRFNGVERQSSMRYQFCHNATVGLRITESELLVHLPDTSVG